MSIQSEISRIQSNVQDTINVIQSTGVAVPPGANSDNLPGLAAALANEKQDKLTGTQGQVVGFDADGNAVAQSPTSSGVTSFEGRTGAVTAQKGDYTAAMVGAVPTTRKVNGKALSADVEIGAVDVDVPTDTAALYGLEDATVDQVLQILKNAAVVNSAGDALETILGSTLLTIPGARIATGSYVGTGTYGQNNPNTLTFDFTPKLWGILCYTQSGAPTLITVTFRVPFGLDVTGGQKYLVAFSGSNLCDIQVHYIGQTAYWNAYDYPGSSPSATEQFNEVGCTYYYFAIG